MLRNATKLTGKTYPPEPLNPRKRKHANDSPVERDVSVKKHRRQKNYHKNASEQNVDGHHPPAKNASRQNTDAQQPPKPIEGKQSDAPLPDIVQTSTVSLRLNQTVKYNSRRQRKRRAAQRDLAEASHATQPESDVPNSDTLVQPTVCTQDGNAKVGGHTLSDPQNLSTAMGKRNRNGKAEGQQVRKTDWSALLKSRNAPKGNEKPLKLKVEGNSKGDPEEAGEAASSRKEGIVESDANEIEESLEDLNEDERLERTIFVGNVPQEARQKDIKKLFKPFGRIESVRIRGVTPVNPKLPKRMAYMTGKFAQFADSHQAYVVFADKEGFEKAMKTAIEQVNMTKYEGNYLRVKYADTKKGNDRNVSLFVGNLPFDCRENELVEAFQFAAEQTEGKLVDARVNRDTETGMGRGIGFVSFNDGLALQACMNEADKLKIRGRTLRVELADKQKKKNTKTFKRPKKKHSRSQSIRMTSSKNPKSINQRAV